jgi:hypothetical protein
MENIGKKIAQETKPEMQQTTEEEFDPTKLSGLSIAEVYLSSSLVLGSFVLAEATSAEGAYV